MRQVSLRDLVGNDADLQLVGDAETVVSDIHYDSRLVTPGDLFVAISGGHFDGHDFVHSAIERGAVAVFAERIVQTAVPSLVAENTRSALPRVAARFFDHPSRDLGVIGITGTDGKTTTSYLVDWILRSAGRTTGLVGTISVRIADQIVDHETRQTTPESLDMQRHLRAMVTAGCEWAVLEATSHGLDLHRLDEIRFSIGAVTNITHEHLEHHKTISAYRRAKGRLFERVGDSGGTAIINLDDEGAREMLRYAGASTPLTYSAEGENADICAENVQVDVHGSRFTLVTPAGVADVSFPYLGSFNVSNALCAVGIALATGVDIKTIAASLATAPPVPGRMARIDCGQPFTVVVDYAHTPDSLSKVLSLLRNLNPDGRLIAVSGSAGDRDRTKRPLQGEVSARLADFSIFTTEDPRFEDADAIIDEIAEGATRIGARPGEHFLCITDREEAIRESFARAKQGDAVVLAGKGHERSIIWGHEKRPWDEGRVAMNLLQEMGYGTCR
jgi:UDP-N-acetylmuramoyl-L-alanyl-D-glutamate--2,6-diaminopimelate ligase